MPLVPMLRQELFPSYRAPSENGQRFCWPDVSEFDEAVNGNRARFKGYDFEVCGQSFSEVRESAKRAIINQALVYTKSYTQVEAAEIASASNTIVLGGHQPELFHPGVWFKNFVVDATSRSMNAIGINFLVDHDLSRALSLRVPVRGTHGRLQTEQILIESVTDNSPWELRYAKNRGDWETFPARVVQRMAGLFPESLILEKLWPKVLSLLDRGWQVGQSIAAARHQIERAYGVKTLELPMSHLCSGPEFARFFLQIISELPRFQGIYNDCRKEYRQFHRIRNEAHPVPALVTQGHWLEAPFWVYSHQAATRRPLFACYLNDRLELTNFEGWSASLCARTDRQQCIDDWQKMVDAGICIRPRALTTTMFARLFLSDLFVHGIGGGKYDQLTDLILQSWLGIDPPTFAVATATLRLPFSESKRGGGLDRSERLFSFEESSTPQQLRQELRDHHYHPERWLDKPFNDRLATLIAKKKGLLNSIPLPGNKKGWHDQLTELNSKLASYLTKRAEAVNQEIPIAENAIRQRSIARSRDFSFALFPEETLISSLKSLAL